MSLAPVSFTPLRAPRFEPPPLGEGAVHVWSFDLRAADETLARLGSLLSTDESRRAERYHFDRHRRRYIVTQGALRSLLGVYADRPAARLGFDLGAKGKPSLRDDPGLHFNVSHSAEAALVALSRGGALGVDIERVRVLADADDIARRFFSRREVDVYLGLDDAARQRAFFDCWTRKEAFVKALGEGLFVSLDHFDVSLGPGEPPRVLAVEGDEEAGRCWRLFDLAVPEGFAACLAMRWSPSEVRAWSLGTAALVESSPS